MAGSIDWLRPLQAEARQRVDAGQASWQLDPESWKYSRIADYLPGAPDLDVSSGAAQTPNCDQVVDFLDLDDDARQLYPAYLERMGTLRHPLADLNLAFLDQGLMIHCAPGESKRLQLGFTGAGHRRLLLDLEAGSQVDLLEVNSEPARAHNLVIQAHLAEGASLTHRRLGSGHGRSWTLIDARLGTGANYDLTGLVCGPQRERLECQLTLLGEHASLVTRHLLLGKQRERLDLQLRIDHRAANTKSRHLIKTLAGDSAQLTVRGRVHIVPNCPHADAELHIKSLIASGTARINAKPELEIYTDDVACAHGTSIAELDPEQLFYLASRGIESQRARALLLKGFAGDCLFTEDQFNQDALQRIEALAS